MQYMEKVVENERTGANISGIRVETQTSALLNRPDLQGLAELERIAKEADQVNLKNKQQKFMLDLEAMDLEFKEKWNDPLIYNDQEKYETMLSEKKALESEKAALVQQNQFFSLGEKDILRQQLSNRHAEFVLKHQKERNAVVLRQAIDDSQANLDQYVTLSSKVNIHDYNRINEYNEQIVENIKSLQTLTGMSDEEVINTAASRIQQATNARYQTYLNDMILSGDLPLQEQERRVNELETVMNDENYKRSVAKELASKLPTDDKKEAEDYFYAKLDTETKSIVGGMKRQFGEIKRARAREEAERKRQIKEMERERRYQEKLYALSQNDPVKYYKAITGKKLTSKQLLNNPLAMKMVANTGWEEYGNLYNAKTFSVLDSKEIAAINREVNFRKQDGSYNDAEVYEPVFRMAQEMSNGDPLKETAILKDYALKNKINPQVFIKGQTNPEYFRMNDLMKKGKTVKNEIGSSVQIQDIGLSRKAKQNFKTIAGHFSNDEELGEAMAEQYVLGKIAKAGKMKDFKENPKRYLEQALTKDKRGYREIKQDVDLAAKLTTKRVDYYYDNIKTEKKQTKKTVTTKKSKFL